MEKNGQQGLPDFEKIQEHKQKQQEVKNETNDHKNYSESIIKLSLSLSDVLRK